MSKGTYNITLVQGDSLSIPFTMTDSSVVPVPINLTTATITSDIKRTPTSTVPDLSFTVTKTDAAAGKFTLSLTPTQTAAMRVTNEEESNIYYYDVEFDYTGNNIQTEFGGTITVLQQVTI